MENNPEKTYILHIETSTKACSVALSENDNCIGYKEFIGQNFSHAEKLPLFIEDIISESVITKNDLSAVSVSSGPGSYTGLRIGCSTAKGLCFALNIPLITVDSLQIPTQLNNQIKDSNLEYISVMKARLNEVFVGHYKNNERLAPVHFEEIETDNFQDLRNNSIVFVGNALDIVKPLVDKQDLWSMESCDNPFSAKGMVKLGYSKFLSQTFEDLAYYEPFYLKDFVVLKKKSK